MRVARSSLSLYATSFRRTSDARASGYAEAVVHVDNHTSKAHTVLQVRRGTRAGTL